jgi:hypothetical protein
MMSLWWIGRRVSMAFDLTGRGAIVSDAEVSWVRAQTDRSDDLPFLTERSDLDSLHTFFLTPDRFALSYRTDRRHLPAIFI